MWQGDAKTHTASRKLGAGERRFRTRSERLCHRHCQAGIPEQRPSIGETASPVFDIKANQGQHLVFPLRMQRRNHFLGVFQRGEGLSMARTNLEQGVLLPVRAFVPPLGKAARRGF